jgi:hypothetical protein
MNYIHGTLSVAATADRLAFLHNSITEVSKANAPWALNDVRNEETSTPRFINGTYVDQAAFYSSSTYGTGQSTTVGTHGIGSTTINVNAYAFDQEAAQLSPFQLMYGILEPGTVREEKVVITAVGSNSFTTTATTISHAAGSVFRWCRFSEQDIYVPGNSYEILLKTGTFVLGSVTALYRYDFGGLQLSIGDETLVYDTDWAAARPEYQLNRRARRISFTHLAGPHGVDGLLCLRAWPAKLGRGGSDGVVVNFDSYSATPEVRLVTVDIPAPTAANFDHWESTMVELCYRSGTHTVAADRVVVPITVSAEAIDAVDGDPIDGRTIHYFGQSGFSTLNYKDSLWDPTHRQRIFDLLGITGVWCELGINDLSLTDTVDEVVADFTELINRYRESQPTLSWLLIPVYPVGDYSAYATLVGSVTQFAESIVISGNAGRLSAGDVIRAVTGASPPVTIGQVIVKSSYVRGNTTVPVHYVRTIGGWPNGTQLAWMDSDAVTASRNKMGLLISPAFQELAETLSNVLFVDVYSKFPSLHAWRARYIDDPTNLDFLHPVTQLARDAFWGAVGGLIETARELSTAGVTGAEAAPAVGNYAVEFDWGVVGLEGTLGWVITTKDNVVLTTRTTDGVSELPGGNYLVDASNAINPDWFDTYGGVLYVYLNDGSSGVGHVDVVPVVKNGALTTAQAAKLANLDAAVSTRATPADVTAAVTSAGVAINVLSPVNADGDTTIVQGDDYTDNAIGDKRLTYTFTGFSGSITGCTVDWRLTSLSAFAKNRAAPAELTVATGAASLAGSTLTIKVPVTGAQTAALAHVSQTDSDPRYRMQVALVTAGGLRVTELLADGIVLKRVG